MIVLACCKLTPKRETLLHAAVDFKLPIFPHIFIGHAVCVLTVLWNELCVSGLALLCWIFSVVSFLMKAGILMTDIASAAFKISSSVLLS